MDPTKLTKVIAEYVFIDGFNNIRSKTRIINSFGINEETKEPKFAIDIWTVDGSSTGQSVTNASDIILNPVCVFNDPFNKSTETFRYMLALCETYNADGKPHITNTRHELLQFLNTMGEEQLQKYQPMFGFEQEYVILDKNKKDPYGWNTETVNMYLRGGIKTQEEGIYYCGVGANCSFGREISMEHMNKCIEAGISICGINAEVAPSQWEFQIGVCNPVEIGDHLWMARYILGRVAESHGVCISYHPKPLGPSWNGSGGHTNFSTKQMRDEGGIEHIYKAIEKLSKMHNEHMEVYGSDNNLRLTGIHETSNMDEFTFGECNRGSSIRIPANVKAAGKGYFEDRRPAANVDPYLVSHRMVQTVCNGDL